MKNYWLSEFIEQNDDDEEDTSDGDSQDQEPNLTPRQKMLYEHYEMVADEFGSFNKGSGPDGAHYASAANNPFKKDGLICANCAFYMNNGCEIVSGKIEPEAICKLWIIPSDLLKG